MSRFILTYLNLVELSCISKLDILGVTKLVAPLVIKGRKLLSQKNNRKALETFSKLIGVLENLNMREASREWELCMAFSYMHKSQALESLGDYQGALNATDKAIDIQTRLSGINPDYELEYEMFLSYKRKTCLLSGLGDYKQSAHAVADACNIISHLVKYDKQSDYKKDLDDILLRKSEIFAISGFEYSEEEEFNTEVLVRDPIYIIGSKIVCYKCKKLQDVITLAGIRYRNIDNNTLDLPDTDLDSGMVLFADIPELPSALLDAIKVYNPLYKKRFSRDNGDRRYYNFCECGATFGDNSIYYYPESCFNPMFGDGASLLTKWVIPVKGTYTLKDAQVIESMDCDIMREAKPDLRILDINDHSSNRLS